MQEAIPNTPSCTECLFYSNPTKMSKISANGKWRIDYFQTKDRSSYFEYDVNYEYRVVNTQTKEVIMTFYYNEYENSNGDASSGASDVNFSDDGKFVIVEDCKGAKETHPLP